MFRECFFEYAGISSRPFNLMLCYLGTGSDTFDSGGKFDLKTDTLVRTHKTLLYGRDYSAQPLSFEVEIVNLDEAIPFEQFIEIKNWLFEQDGWKTLKLLDERQDYYLKCVFLPGEDIADGSGYRGLRCTIQNDSPFWYGEPIIKEFDHDALQENITEAKFFWYEGSIHADDVVPYGVISINIDDPNFVDADYYPHILVEDARGNYQVAGLETYTDDTVFGVCLANTDAKLISDGESVDDSDVFTYPDVSRIAFSTSYIGDDPEAMTIDNYDNIDVYPQYGYAKSQRPAYVTHQFLYFNPPITLFKLHKGVNICRVLEPTLYRRIVFAITPMYRVGAF